MDYDLELIKWAYDCKISFSPAPQKQAVELVFSKKSIEIHDPEIRINNIPVMKVEEHMHLGLKDSKLSFSVHIKAAISKTRRKSREIYCAYLSFGLSPGLVT